jgi:hypothetical protein
MKVFYGHRKPTEELSDDDSKILHYFYHRFKNILEMSQKGQEQLYVEQRTDISVCLYARYII